MRAHKAKRHPNKQTKKTKQPAGCVKLLCNDKQTNKHAYPSVCCRPSARGRRWGSPTLQSKTCVRTFRDAAETKKEGESFIIRFSD